MNIIQRLVYTCEQQKFCNYQYDKEGIVTFLLEIEELVDQITKLGKELSDNIIITKVLMSLPSEYHAFVTAWEGTQINDRKMNKLTARLLIEDNILKSRLSVSVNRSYNQSIISVTVSRKYSKS
ncbi:hypothetical protein JTB14_002314 [Gonioctena quinquepunctata]|nr:hypothetical protein JTB14_002314 [Gonioctena quinquepunctata]